MAMLTARMMLRNRAIQWLNRPIGVPLDVSVSPSAESWKNSAGRLSASEAAGPTGEDAKLQVFRETVERHG
jgi:hypothetical protein